MNYCSRHEPGNFMPRSLGNSGNLYLKLTVSRGDPDARVSTSATTRNAGTLELALCNVATPILSDRVREGEVEVYVYSIKSFLISLLALVVTSLPTLAQEHPAAAPAQQRPTLGLVLQGGGALGLAHVGVITWLEEHHIPVNYIAGTSMGGPVGGVCATGHNVAEMRKIVGNSSGWSAR
jgi:hypothetical protein